VTLNVGHWALRSGRRVYPEFLSRSFGRADGQLYEPGEGHDINEPVKLQLGKSTDKGERASKRWTQLSMSRTPRNGGLVCNKRSIVAASFASWFWK